MRRILQLGCLCVSLGAAPGTASEGPPSRWITSASLLFGDSGPHGQALDGVVSAGWRAFDSVALMILAEGEQGLSSVQPFSLASAGVGVRLIGDTLGGLAGPIELTFGIGASAVVEGTTPAGQGPLGVASFDLLFPVVWRVRLHWQLLEHFAPGGTAFLTTSAGLGLVWE